MDYDNLQLRSKTFLDFTDDEEIIEEIVGDKDDREFFLTHVNEYSRSRTFIFFADFTPDKKLAAAIKKEFDRELRHMFDE
jgi:hypothetical protein